MAAPIKSKPIRAWEPEDDEMDGRDEVLIYQHQVVGSFRVSPSGSGSPVEEAFRIIGSTSPADNPQGQSEYEFGIPGIGHFSVTVGFMPEGKQ